MPGTKSGAAKAVQTNKELYGEDFYAKIGAKGGKLGRTGGFYANRELARRAGAKGGRKSSREGVKNGEGKSKSREYTKSSTQSQEQRHGIMAGLRSKIWPSSER